MSRRNKVMIVFLCVLVMAFSLACVGGGGDGDSLSDVCADRLETNEQIGSILE